MEKKHANNQPLLFPEVEGKYVADRLREARMARGYNISEFANFIGLSKQVISQYEIGRTKPSTETLQRISRGLKLPISYFTNPRSRQSEGNTIFFRSLEVATKKDRERLRCRLHWAADIFAHLSEFIDFPPVDLPTIDDYISIKDRGVELNCEHRVGIGKHVIDEIAYGLRSKWKLGHGPITNLISLLESKGIIVVKEPFFSRVTGDVSQAPTDALSGWINGRPFVYLSQDKESAARSRFDAAHELGHLLLHYDVEITSKSILNDIEKEANYFAGTFLLPKNTFGKEVTSLSTSLNHFEVLKRRWKVSIAAMMYRCNKDLAVLSESQARYLWRQLNAKGWRIKEPLDDELEEEIPSLLNRAIIMLSQHQIRTPSEIREHLHLHQSDLISICGLPSDFFDSSEEKLVQLDFKNPTYKNR